MVCSWCRMASLRSLSASALKDWFYMSLSYIIYNIYT